MRRFVAGLSLFAVLAQSSGAALAASPDRVGSISPAFDFAALIAPFRTAITGSQVWAQYTGQGNRWTAEHLPGPTPIPQAQLPYPAPTPTDYTHEGRYAGHGAQQLTPWMSTAYVAPQFAPPDPLAMCSGYGGYNARRVVHHRVIGGNGRPAEVRHSAHGRERYHAETTSGCVGSTPSPGSPPTPTPTSAPSATPSPVPSDSQNAHRFDLGGGRPIKLQNPINGTPPRAGTPIVGVPPRVTTPIIAGGGPPRPRPGLPGREHHHTAGTNLPAPTTGIERFWDYEEGALPGVGKYMVNVSTGNLVVQADDLDVHDVGIDLAFRRTYNSQSQEANDLTGSGFEAVYGQGWTNNFDAHLIWNVAPGGGGVMSLYDIDGARCDYTPDGNGNWVPCAGHHEALTLDSNGCGYLWTRTSGTAYHFFSPTGACLNGRTALAGRLTQIFARDNNNVITFHYFFDNSDGTNANNLNRILVTHSDGDSITLTFADVMNTNYRMLQSITRPDGLTITYSYNQYGRLTEVTRPGNDAAPPQSDTCAASTPHCIPEEYEYTSGVLSGVDSPRYVVCPNADNGDGNKTVFIYDANGNVSQVYDRGLVNATPSNAVNFSCTSPWRGYGNGDATGALLQPNVAATPFPWRTQNYVIQGQGQLGLQSTMTDTDGHSTIWVLDQYDRVVLTDEWTGSNSNPSPWIYTEQSWDANNNVTQTIDYNGNTTNYAYDIYGDTVEVAAPAAPVNGGASAQSISTYNYDVQTSTVNGATVTWSPHNVSAYCDPIHNAGMTFDGSNTGGDSKCNGSQATVYVWDYTASNNEPYGRLVTTMTPMGYHHHILYDTGGLGLPVEVYGDAISQIVGPAQRVPTQNFQYDPFGDLIEYDKGKDPSGNLLQQWQIGYYNDPMHRPHSHTDADGVLSWTCYNNDGSVLFEETAWQHSTDGTPTSSSGCPSAAALSNSTIAPPKYATAYNYDLDGNQTQIRQYKGGTAGYTVKYYDGADRLVEVVNPYDAVGGGSTEYYKFPWMTRYLYDLSGKAAAANYTLSNGQRSTASFDAYGNLYDTQEYLPAPAGDGTDVVGTTTSGATPSPLGRPQWVDVRGTGFDALDRPLKSWELAFGVIAKTINAYDGNGYLGLLSSTTNAMSQTDTYAYDALNRKVSDTFSGPTPLADNRSYGYDRDGHMTSATNSLGELDYGYDPDGHETSVKEPTGESAASVITYSLYADGTREALSVAPRAGSVGGIDQTNLFEYGYRRDGLLAAQSVSWSAVPSSVTAGGFTWTYTNAGRELKQFDPLTGTTVSNQDVATVTYGAKQYQYDPYGRVSSLTLPEGYTSSSHTYDEDDELTGFQMSVESGVGIANSKDAARRLGLNVRGELLSQATTGTWLSPDNTPLSTIQPVSGHPAASANGTLMGGGSVWQPNNLDVDGAAGIDARSGMSLASGANYNNLPSWNTFTYDGAGRQTSITAFSRTANRTYDAENHIVNADSGPSCSGACTYAHSDFTWGPDGRLRVAALKQGYQTKDSNESEHWDGDTLLFSVNPGQGNAPVLFIGKLGTLFTSVNGTNSQLFIADRDQSGTQQSQHYSTGFDAWSIEPSWRYSGTGQYGHAIGPFTIYGDPGSCNGMLSDSGVATPCGGSSFTVFGTKRPDGYDYAYGGFSFQGVRVYDSVSSQWLTPDAYAGNVHDPMSQKPFMWNGNNPIGYGDPSGYDPKVTTTTDSSGNLVVNIDFKVKLTVDQGVSKDDIQKFIDNVKSASGWTGDFQVNVTCEVVGDDYKGTDATAVHLENSDDWKDHLGGAPANGAPGHGNIRRADGGVWDVRVGTNYGGDDEKTRAGQIHEMMHNAGVVHAENAPDVMAGYMDRSGEHAVVTDRDVFQILNHAGIGN